MTFSRLFSLLQSRLCGNFGWDNVVGGFGWSVEGYCIADLKTEESFVFSRECCGNSAEEFRNFDGIANFLFE